MKKIIERSHMLHSAVEVVERVMKERVLEREMKTLRMTSMSVENVQIKKRMCPATTNER